MYGPSQRGASLRLLWACANVSLAVLNASSILLTRFLANCDCDCGWPGGGSYIISIGSSASLPWFKKEGVKPVLWCTEVLYAWASRFKWSSYSLADCYVSRHHFFQGKVEIFDLTVALRVVRGCPCLSDAENFVELFYYFAFKLRALIWMKCHWRAVLSNELY